MVKLETGKYSTEEEKKKMTMYANTTEHLENPQ